jgi:predicted nuclease of restriction endonuclease-like (RecB) superfamily
MPYPTVHFNSAETPQPQNPWRTWRLGVSILLSSEFSSTSRIMTAKKKPAAKRAPNKAAVPQPAAAGEAALFDRVAAILEQARGNVIRAVNSNMVLAYWLIGREIVQEIQGGGGRAGYGKQVLEGLSGRLASRYGRGYSPTNLRYFRMFYQTFADRVPMIGHKVSGRLDGAGGESGDTSIHHKACDEFGSVPPQHDSGGVLEDLSLAIEHADQARGFSPNLSWSHYRTLLSVENKHERLFYEIEAAKENWSVPQLERQIHTWLFARLLKSRDKAGVLAMASKGHEVLKPIDAIKHPYVLDFLDLPEDKALHESELEAAIMDKLQPFLLELGKGFAFVARQHRITADTQHFYIDLVFYNYLLKCFVVIDLKIGKLAHQDIGQLDMYVRMFDELRRGAEDNPTVGLILCAEKDEVVAKYSVLEGSQQLFASKYMRYLPTEQELREEIERERRLIEAQAGTVAAKSKPSKKGRP